MVERNKCYIFTLSNNKTYIMNYKVYDIDYDTDGEVIDLPTELIITVPKTITDEVEISEYLSDEISNQTGFCHNGFNYIKTVTYDDTRDVSIRVINKLIELGHLTDNDDTYFEIQDTIHDEINDILGLDIDDNFEINIK